jgi:Flp pilus assembly secretin CpaC
VFTASPAYGYRVFRWTLNGAVVTGSPMNTYTLSNIGAASVVSVSFERTDAVASGDRVVPGAGVEAEAVVSAPSRRTEMLTAGPNVASASSATPVRFFWYGTTVKTASLYVYDASGNTVNKITADRKDAALPSAVVAQWNLKDKTGRLVGEGTYLVKGVVTTKTGTERVSVFVVVVK